MVSFPGVEPEISTIRGKYISIYVYTYNDSKETNYSVLEREIHINNIF